MKNVKKQKEPEKKPKKKNKTVAQAQIKKKDGTFTVGIRG